MPGRSELRRKWAQGVRIQALEHDFDKLEGDLDKRDGRIDEALTELRNAFSRQTAALIGMLITFGVAAALLALNLGVVGR